MLRNSCRKYHLFFIGITFCLAFPQVGRAQSNNVEAVLYNISIGAVFSGVGAVINKDPGEKFGNTLLKGMAQGALGGYLVYESKVLVGMISKKEQLEYSWPAKFVNSAGISIIENAASNRNFWEQWNLHLGFNRIEFHTGEDFEIRYKIMPAALAFTVYSAWSNKFEVRRSLQAGEFIFSSPQISYFRNGIVPAGLATGTAITIMERYLDAMEIYAHEIIHVYQYQDFNVFNTYINKPLEEFKEGSGFFRTMDRFFYYDLNMFPLNSLYILEDFNIEPGDKYSKNYFEREADFYSN